MRVLITGGLGQIGSHVAEMLLERGDEVLVIDNLATGRVEHLSPAAGLSVVIGSIADKELVEAQFSLFQPDAVLHAAASYKDPEDWYEDAMTNCVGGANIVSAAKNHGSPRFVYLQTSLCYGLDPVESPISLTHPLNPQGSSYAISKTANELYLQLSGLDFVTFRLANVIGPRNLAGPLPIFYSRLNQGKGCFVSSTRRDFVFVKDLAAHIVKALGGMGSGTYHFSSGEDVPIADLYFEVARAMGLEPAPEPEVIPAGPDDVGSILLDPSRTATDFGEFAPTALGQIVDEAVAYYQEHGTRGEVTHLKIEKS